MMNPHQKNKVDVKSLSPEEQRLFRLYGKLPSRSDHFAKHLKERKYFDSGDYAMSQAGKGDSVDTGAVGSQHPVPENIPHLSSPNGSTGTSGLGLAGTNGAHHHHGSVSGPAGQAAQAAAGSPVKESSFLNRETSADEEAADENQQQSTVDTQAADGQAIPIRR